MQHHTYISDKPEIGAGPKLLALAIVVAILAAVAGYVVYGSGMWNPPVAQTTSL
jgi:hypothetical protein